MSSNLVLKGDFNEIWVINMERPCMIKFSLEFKERNPIYRNKAIIDYEAWTENWKDRLTRFCCDDRKLRNDLQLRMSVDHDLQLHDKGIDQIRVLKVVISNSL
jgi:hypothetical protein